jgi:vacuolar iron transporter family protein
MDDIKQGLFFGINSGIITTAGLISGLVQTNISYLYLIISIFSLAISDSISEGYSMYLSNKVVNEKDKSNGPLVAMISLMFVKFVVVISFLIPLIFTKDIRIYKNMIWVGGWSIVLILILNYQLCVIRNESFFSYFIPHIGVLVFVILLTKYFGKMTKKYIN